MVRKRKPTGEAVRLQMIYFGIKAPSERIPQILWAERKYAALALAAMNVTGLRIVRTYVTIQIIEGPTRRSARAVS